MRALRNCYWVLAACAVPNLAFAQAPTPAPAPPSGATPSEPPKAAPAPPSGATPSEPPKAAPVAPSGATIKTNPAATPPEPEPAPILPVAPPPPPAPPPGPTDTTAPPAEVLPAPAPSPPGAAASSALSETPPATPSPGPSRAVAIAAEPARFPRHYEAWPLALEARFGFNARLGSSFEGASSEELLGASYSLAAYLAWNAEYALGIELEHAGLGRVRALSGENSIDAEYSATSAWLAARVFPWRSERLDLFVNLRLGLAVQHVDALGTRQESASITVPATSFSCSETGDPGFALGGAIGLAYRLSRHASFVSRVDGTGQRLSGETLGTCADGIGSVTSVSGTVGLAFEFETAKDSR